MVSVHKYYVMIEGANFTSHIGSLDANMGFFASFQFEGEFKNGWETLDCVNSLLKIRLKANKHLIDKTQSSFFLLQEIALLEEFSESRAFEEGFSLFSITRARSFLYSVEYSTRNILANSGLINEYKKPVAVRKK